MLGTKKITRTPPSRRFENYIMTRAVDSSVGLSNIPDFRFTQVPGPALFGPTDVSLGAGAPLTDDAISTPVEIGFDFSFDGITYKNWAACTNGWMVLVDPSSRTFSFAEVLNFASWENVGIKSTFTSNAVLLCPWFDDLRNSANDASQLTQGSYMYSSTKTGRIKSGLEGPPIFLNSQSYGISYYRDHRSPKGRRLIVRWSSASNFNQPTSVIRFEVIIYENGTIEYRYTPRFTIHAPTTVYEGATCGIFMPNGTNRFRDFSIGLGYRDNVRQEYLYGGYQYDTHYLDTHVSGSEDAGTGAVPYTVNLLPFKHWPGLASSGCVISFVPPQLRRKVLPRRLIKTLDAVVSYPLVARNGGPTIGSGLNVFDDRKSPNYISSSAKAVVNYPTTMPRFFGGNGLGVTERQNLFSGDMLVTSSVVKSAIDHYVSEPIETYLDPFNENKMPEQGSATLNSSFFLTGSAIDHLPEGFDQQLRSKTTVRFALVVNTQVIMPTTTASIYYYNASARAWEVPANSTYILGSSSVQPPSPNPYAGGDWANPQHDLTGSRIIEDARGFGPIGNPVSSGSNTSVLGSDQTDANIGSSYGYKTFASSIGKSYPKSVRNNSEYAPNSDETFTLPISAPFLIEKAVFEIPITAGAGWFADLTQCFVPVTTNGTPFDFAGPALTLSLMRQVQLSKTQPQVSVRDLIMTGTITHAADATSTLVLSNFPPVDSTFQLRPVGFGAYGGIPSAIVTAPANNQFTGSVAVPMTAASSVGVFLQFTKLFNSGSSGSIASQISQFISSTQTLALVNNSSSSTQTVRIAYIDPVGRGGTGFQPSGRAVLGNEFVTLQGLRDQTGLTVTNPFYVSGTLSNPMAKTLSSPPTSSFSVRASTVIPLVSSFPSPYLVFPGDKLILGISKMRPIILKPGATAPQFSGSISHDISLNKGTIYVTLYGSEIQEGHEHHPTTTQVVASDVVHELIGAEPILDQFDVPYHGELSGSFSDNVVLGSMRSSTGRGRRLSWLGARNTAPLTTSSVDIAINPYKGYRAQPWWERAGNVRLVQFTDSTERYWDSMMPSVSECFAADGCGIFITPAGTFGDFRQIDANITGSNTGYNPRKIHPGWVFMDFMVPSLGLFGYDPIVNGNWSRSFPFEPRYQNSSRQLDVEKSLLATYIYQPSQDSIVVPITPTPVSGLIFGTAALLTSVNNQDGPVYTPNTPGFDWFVDSNMSGKALNTFTSPTIPSQMYSTGSMPSDDTSRALFGFGDKNTNFQFTNLDSSTSLLGTSHFPDWRDIEGPHPDGVYTSINSDNFCFSPLIRGWKYGVISGIPLFTKSYWRHNRFGQFRDMLEQRQYSKFYQDPSNAANVPNFRQGTQPAAVTINFIDQTTGRLTSPDNTFSSNLHFECTSSVPFFDGLTLNRPTINPTNLNLHPTLIKRDVFDNIHIA